MKRPHLAHPYLHRIYIRTYVCTHPCMHTYKHTYVHNCEGVKKPCSLVKSETKQRLYSRHVPSSSCFFSFFFFSFSFSFFYIYLLFFLLCFASSGGCLPMQPLAAKVSFAMCVHVYVHKCVQIHSHTHSRTYIHIGSNVSVAEKGFLFSFHHACFIHLYLKA